MRWSGRMSSHLRGRLVQRRFTGAGEWREVVIWSQSGRGERMADKRACWDASRSAVILANTRGWIRGRIRSGGRDPRRLQGVNPRGTRAVNVKMVGILVRKKAGECQVEDNLVETREAFGIEDWGVDHGDQERDRRWLRRATNDWVKRSE
jgi:hypothetical protein